MPDILDLIRLKNIFSSPMNGSPANDLPEQGGFGGNLPRDIGPIKLGMPDYPDREMFPIPPMRADSIPVSSNDYNPEARMAALYHPDHTYEDMYQKTLGEMPQRNKPGIVRKIFGAMAGMGGRAEDVDRTLYAPYYRNLADWDAKIKAIQPGLQYERYGNTANLSSARDVIRSEESERRADDRYKMFEESEDRKRKYGEEKQDIERQKLALQKFKQDNPDWKLEKVEGGNYVWFNPQTRERADSGVKTGTLSEADEIVLKGNQSVRVANVNAANAQELERTRQAGRMSIEEYKTQHPNYRLMIQKGGNVFAFNPETKELEDTGISSGTLSDEEKIKLGTESKIEVKKTESGSKTAGGMLPTQQRIDLVNRANRLLIQHPEWKSYITVDKNDVKVRKPWFGGDDTILKQIQTELGSSPVGQEVEVKGNKNTPAPAPAGNKRVRVKGPNGESGTMLESELKDFPDWKVVP